MHLLILALGLTAQALPNLTPTILAYRSWDLHLFSEAVPTCNVNNSNSNLTVFHRYGAYDRTCEAIDTSLYNVSVKSFSWKSPSANDR
ncbi:hypothetical protein PENDEC_c003G03321 [Penicillium decumbens]|uniref:AA1-like domain-containing protein n=1 Tax=Penicillium decumbens TaxID=69771 RepID=A0A1V6PJZ3_PENDC|nr:hypothetical protein PENDEC_c003G03321 [Penicillium decumbens]